MSKSCESKAISREEAVIDGFLRVYKAERDKPWRGVVERLSLKGPLGRASALTEEDADIIQAFLDKNGGGTVEHHKVGSPAGNGFIDVGFAHPKQFAIQVRTHALIRPKDPSADVKLPPPR